MNLRITVATAFTINGGLSHDAAAQQPAGYSADLCPSCAAWNRPHDPVKIFGNSYWVGTEGLGAILIATDEGHVLIDGGLPESGPIIQANIEALGFDLGNVRLLLNSHAHYDHGGGIGYLQEHSGATVAATAPSAYTLERGRPGESDPQYRSALPYPPSTAVERFEAGDSLRLGNTVVISHATAGHTPGGTTWSWDACEEGRCLRIVYADSLTPVSDDDFEFSDNETYPAAVGDFRRAHQLLMTMRCDILVTPHPGASLFWERVEARDAGDPDALVDGEACRKYGSTAAERLDARLDRERGPR